MGHARRTAAIVSLLGIATLLGSTRSARAGALNDPACVPAAAHPHPVVLVHGQGATADIFTELGIVATLTGNGYCVYATNHGQDTSGRYGRAHLAVSASQTVEFIEYVLNKTGATQVDVVAHSAGTGVIGHIILALHRGELIHRAVSFGGLHHPYAHVDVGVDTNLFLPNLVETARRVTPGVTAQQVITAALDLYTTAGGPLFGLDAELAKSDFVADLFDPEYWAALHGNLSEPPDMHLVPGRNRRTLATADSDPDVCYTNIVGIADVLAGASAGFQDDAPNVDNFLLMTPADHVQMLADATAQTKLLGALAGSCGGPPTGDPMDDPMEDPGDGGPFTAGCMATRGTSASWLALLGVLGLVRRRRDRSTADLAGKRVLITGAARGIGAALAVRLHQRGARVGVVGLEEPLLEQLSCSLGGAPWRPCNVARRNEVDAAVTHIASELGGLDVVVANAGIAAQLPLVGGDPRTFEAIMDVNVLGAYYTLRAAGPHISHPAGYAVAVASLAAAVHLPLMGAYCASKAAVEALGNSLRIELKHTGAKVGIAYFGEIETDMTERGFGTRAAAAVARFGAFTRPAPLEDAIAALEHGIADRTRVIAAPRFVAPMLPVRALVQRFVDARMRSNLDHALAIAREEDAPLTTAQPPVATAASIAASRS